MAPCSPETGWDRHKYTIGLLTTCRSAGGPSLGPLPVTESLNDLSSGRPGAPARHPWAICRESGAWPCWEAATSRPRVREIARGPPGEWLGEKSHTHCMFMWRDTGEKCKPLILKEGSGRDGEADGSRSLAFFSSPLVAGDRLSSPCLPLRVLRRVCNKFHVLTRSRSIKKRNHLQITCCYWASTLAALWESCELLLLGLRYGRAGSNTGRQCPGAGPRRTGRAL